MAALMPQGKQQYFTAGGIPLVGGKVYTYAAGTTTPLATYTTAAASTPNTNPVILDSRGEASIFFSAANYKIVVKDSLDSTIWTQDNLPGDQAATILANLAASTGSSLVGYLPAGTGAVATTVQKVLRETVSAALALPDGYVTDGSVDYTTQIAVAVSVATVLGAKLHGVAGTYKVTGTGLLLNSPLDFDMRGMILKNSSGNVLRVAGEGVNLSNGTLWSVGGGHTVVQTAAVDQFNWSGMTMYQDATGYSLWDNAGFDYVDMRHENFLYQHALSATVAGFNLVGTGGTINDNVWANGRCNYSGNYFFNVESTSANFQYSNSWNKLTFEECKGGGILQKAAMLFSIDDCQNWDCGVAAITRHFYSVQLNGSGIGSIGKFRNCGRWAGSNAAAIYDIQLPAGGGGAGITIDTCTTSGGGDPFTADLRNNGVACIVPSFNLFSSINNSGRFVVGPANNGIQFGGTVNGAFLTYYDEGSITPTLTGGGTFTYSTQVAQWTRKGREVRVIGYIVIATVAGLGGVVKIGTMPFTIPNTLASYGSGNVTGENMTAGATGQLSLNASIGTTNVNLIRFLAGALIPFDGTLLQAGSAIYFDYAYFV